MSRVLACIATLRRRQPSAGTACRLVTFLGDGSAIDPLAFGGHVFSIWRGLKNGAAQIRAGDVIERNGTIFRVTKFHHMHGQARAAGFIVLDLLNIQSTARTSEKLRLDEQLELVELEKRNLQVLYVEGDSVHVMDGSTYEQQVISRELFGEGKRWLETPDLTVDAALYQGQIVSASLPYKVAVKVVDAPALTVPKDDGTTNRHVVVEGGISVTAPAFVRTGDTIVVRTEDASYMTKVNA